MKNKLININGRDLIVTNEGKVYYQKRNGVLKETGLTKNGKYKQVNCNKKMEWVHRIIAMAFCEKPEHLKDIPFDELDVDHINTDGGDNRAVNLRWCTRKENCNNPFTLAHYSSAFSKPIIQYTKDGKTVIAEWGSAVEAEKETNVGKTHIYECINGKRKSAGGYIWKHKS